MKYIAEICQTSFLIYYLLIYLLEEKKKIFIFSYPIITVVSCIILHMLSYNAFCIDVIHVALYFIFPILIIRKRTKRVLYICLICLGVSSSILSIVNIIVFCFCTSDMSVLLSTIISVALLIMLFAFMFLKKNFVDTFIRLFDLIPAIKIIFPLIIWTFFFLLSSEYAAMTLSMNIEVNIIILFITLILLIASIVLFAYLIINNLKKQHYKKLSDLLEDNIIKQAKHYEKTIKRYNDLRTFKHDYNNLKIGLNNLLETGQIDEAIKYLNSSDEKFKAQYQLINTGNTIVDAIFSDKQSEIIQNNIKIKFNGIIPYDALEIADLCVVLGNSLDNAVEACAKISENIEKIIEIEVKKNRELLLIQMKNPIHDKVNINNNTVKTTKENAEVHGIGFYSINNIVKKYDGFYEIESDDTHFTLKMGFMIKQKISDAVLK